MIEENTPRADVAAPEFDIGTDNTYCTDFSTKKRL
jgi:hypothetical protein